ncbi:hypothetical protein COE25_18890 [Bacillus sp. AFS031507]|nr:hypothetical protein COE25_18890 [Bacillus sp. AFS031507]
MLNMLCSFQNLRIEKTRRKILLVEKVGLKIFLMGFADFIIKKYFLINIKIRKNYQFYLVVGIF